MSAVQVWCHVQFSCMVPIRFTKIYYNACQHYSLFFLNITSWLRVTSYLQMVDFCAWFWRNNYEAPLVPFRPKYYALRPSCFVDESLHCNFALRIFVHDSSCPNFAPLTFVGYNRVQNFATSHLRGWILESYLRPSPLRAGIIAFSTLRLHWRRIVGESSCKKIRWHTVQEKPWITNILQHVTKGEVAKTNTHQRSK